MALGEHGTDGAGEAGEDVEAVEGVVLLQGRGVRAGAVHIDGLGVGEDYPDQRGSVAEPHLRSVAGLAAGVAGRDDFYDQVGNDFGLAVDLCVQWDLLC